jgi:hypothetical protein
VPISLAPLGSVSGSVPEDTPILHVLQPFDVIRPETNNSVDRLKSVTMVCNTALYWGRQRRGSSFCHDIISTPLSVFTVIVAKRSDQCALTSCKPSPLVCDLYFPRMKFHELNVRGDKYCKIFCAVQSWKKPPSVAERSKGYLQSRN